MKYIYLFILFAGLSPQSKSEESELNKEQGKQIESLIITSQDGEKAVINKAIIAGTAYYIGKLYDEVTPMAASDQFVMPVLKFGIPGKEPEYTGDNESPRLLLCTGKSNGCYS